MQRLLAFVLLNAGLRTMEAEPSRVASVSRDTAGQVKTAVPDN
jgi:hypothetical protein